VEKPGDPAMLRDLHKPLRIAKPVVAATLPIAPMLRRVRVRTGCWRSQENDGSEGGN
jgi:hypothetical protein